MIEHNKILAHVIDIIKKYASEGKPIDQNEILAKLQADPDTFCERKTVTRALEKLRADYGPDDEGNWSNMDMKLHFDTWERSSSPIYKQYWFEIHGDGLSDEELMFLMLAVQFSKHVDQGYAEDIVSKLRTLSDNKYSSKFELFTILNEKNHPVKSDYFMNLEDINEAIDKDKMISFDYNEYGIDKDLHPTGSSIEVSPYKVVGLDGDLYLLCTKRNSKVMKGYRLDRISDLQILDENSQFPAEKSTARLRTNEYLSEHPYLYSGEVVDVTMIIDRSVLGDVIYSFGNKFKIDPADESMNRLTIHLKSSERDVIEWAMRYGEHALVIEPEYLRNEIRDRATLLSRFYREEETDIHYLEQIERAERLHRLFLINTDLSSQDSYRYLNGIETATFRHNGINDFSFLTGYTELRELEISHNEICDPGVLSELGDLRRLNLGMTGITNLDFLSGLENLVRLSLNEYSLENVEAVYSMPELRVLAVSKPVSRLIDKRRLERAYGPSFRYIIDDGSSRFPMLMGRNTLPPAERFFHPLRDDADEVSAFSSCELNDVSIIEAILPQIYAGSRGVPHDNQVFCILEGACDGTERRRLYEDIGHYSSDEYVWHVTYRGTPGEQLSVNDIGRISAISIFKRDHGLKLVGMFERMPGRDYEDNQSYREYRNKVSIVRYAHIRYLMYNNIGWAEVSDRLEMLFFRFCTLDEVVNPADLMNHNVFSSIEIDSDEYHYYRKINGVRKKVKKIVYGHIELE